MDTRWKEGLGYCLEQGLALYAEEKVNALVSEDNRATANVDGFSVALTLREDGRCVQEKCTCPRTEQHCGHIAAVLYALEKPDISWEQELDQMLKYIYQKEYLEHEEAWDLAENMADALQHVLLENQAPEQLENALHWLGKVYHFAMEWQYDPDIDPDYSQLVAFCEAAFQKLFDRLSPQQREQMRLWFLDYIGHTYPEHLYYTVNYFFQFPWEAEKENLQALSQCAGKLPKNHPLHRLLAERQANLHG